ncbi:hypothetical protein DERP_003690 [Dermatophagoides pteronyssinus]|uniref:Uncharacterized protein n=1 Tax=Dermatophagoides pteronyssinus TaxID=6956 RepID=A0ABQ8JLB7_DERPT|nr:hypothetical protein DERP_003690 [Dermatophagoides pteronyssinus]
MKRIWTNQRLDNDDCTIDLILRHIEYHYLTRRQHIHIRKCPNGGDQLDVTAIRYTSMIKIFIILNQFGQIDVTLDSFMTICLIIFDVRESFIVPNNIFVWWQLKSPLIIENNFNISDDVLVTFNLNSCIQNQLEKDFFVCTC